MKSKSLIIVIVIGLIVLGGIGVMVLSGKKAATVPTTQVGDEVVATIKPEDIGLVLSASTDNKEVILEVNKTEGISGLDYELSYTAKGDIPRGVIGHIDIKQPGKKITQEITLGTCSDVCHYDQDVSNIKLILKVTKADGTSGQVEKTLELE